MTGASCVGQSGRRGICFRQATPTNAGAKGECEEPGFCFPPFGTFCDSQQGQDAGWANMQYQTTRRVISLQDLAQDRAFWRDLLARRARSRGLPAHCAGGFRNRRFAIIRNAAWITLYRARLPNPQVGVFLRCTGLAGEAFFTLADGARAEIEPRLRAEIGSEAVMEWGTSHHPGMIDIAAILAAPLPWIDRAAGQHMTWMLPVGAVWWSCFASLAEGSEVESSSAAKQGKRASAKAGLGERSG